MKLRLILLLIPIEAFSNTRVTIKSISGRSYNDQVTPELIWKKNADNANVLYLGVKLKGLPEVPSAAKLKSGTWNKENKNEFEVYLESQVDTMASKDSSGISKFSFQAQSELSEPIETGCEGFGFKLSKQFSENIPFFLGMSCEKSSDKETKVTLSAPKEAEWGETDLFESQGKGERWKQYLVPTVKRSTEDRSLGDLIIDLKGASYKFQLIQLKDAKLLENSLKTEKLQNELKDKEEELEKEKQKIQEAKEKIKQYVKAQKDKEKKKQKSTFEMRGGLGLGMISTKATGTSANSILPTLLLDLKTPKFLSNFKLALGMRYGLPLSLGTAGTSFSHIQAGALYEIGQTDSFKFEPGFYIVTLAQDFDPTELSFRHTNLGFGFDLLISSFRLSFLASGMAPKGDSTLMSFGLGYDFKAQDGVKSWGLGFAYQMTSYPLFAGKFNQMIPGVYFYF